MWVCLINKEIINVYICLHGHINIHIKQASQLEKRIYSYFPIYFLLPTSLRFLTVYLSEIPTQHYLPTMNEVKNF